MLACEFHQPHIGVDSLKVVSPLIKISYLSIESCTVNIYYFHTSIDWIDQKLDGKGGYKGLIMSCETRSLLIFQRNVIDTSALYSNGIMSTFCLFHNKLLSAGRRQPLNRLPCLIRNTFHTWGRNSISPGLFCQLTLVHRQGRFLHYFSFLCPCVPRVRCCNPRRARPWPRTHIAVTD